MRHQIRWTAQKISNRLALIEAQTYRQRHEISMFRYHYLTDPLDPPLVAPELDDDLMPEIPEASGIEAMIADEAGEENVVFSESLARQIQASAQSSPTQPEQIAQTEWQTILNSMQSGVKTIKDVVGGKQS